MGRAPKILEGLEHSSEVQREKEQWYLDASVEALQQEIEPKRDLTPQTQPTVRPQPVRVARQTFD
jgi:hypothetical protein